MKKLLLRKVFFVIIGATASIKSSEQLTAVTAVVNSTTFAVATDPYNCLPDDIHRLIYNYLYIKNDALNPFKTIVSLRLTCKKQYELWKIDFPALLERTFLEFMYTKNYISQMQDYENFFSYCNFM